MVANCILRKLLLLLSGPSEWLNSGKIAFRVHDQKIFFWKHVKAVKHRLRAKDADGCRLSSLCVYLFLAQHYKSLNDINFQVSLWVTTN